MAVTDSTTLQHRHLNLGQHGSPQTDIQEAEKNSREHVEDTEKRGIDSESPMLKTTTIMVFLGFFIGLGGFIVNFDLGYTGLVLVMEPFNKAFGTCTMEKGKEVCALSATQQSISSSIYLLFMSLGAAISGVSANFLGTRGSIQFGCIWTIVGAAGMLGTAGNLTAYVACKCIGAIGIGHLQTMSTTFGVECAPPKHRGLLITLYSVGSGLGALIVSCICLGTVTIPDSWSWKTPIILQIPLALVYAVGFFLFPESPRWLLSHGKIDQGRQSFARLYRRNPDSSEVDAQVRDVLLAVEEETMLTSAANWTDIFHRSFIRRTLTSLSINVAGALSGAFFIFTYTAIFFKQIGGFTSSIEISTTINACLFAGLLMGPFIVEFFGRRRTIISGYLGMMTCMLIFAAVSSALGSTSETVHDVLIAFLSLWAFTFGGCIASSQWLTSAEMHAVRHRSAGQAFVVFITNIFVFGSNFWTPYMLNVDYGNMGTNVGYFYFGCEAVALAVLFLLLPENGRLTLEQIDQYFQSGRKPWKTSLARNKRIARGEIGVNDD